MHPKKLPIQGKHSGGPIGYSKLSISLTRKQVNSEMFLDWELPVGKGITNNPESGLLRPFKYILKDGKPIGRLVYLFYQDNGQHYVLGTLIHQKKLLFFPGGDLGRLIEYVPKDEQLCKAHIDHFTLDENYNTWHVTFKEKDLQNLRIPQKRTWSVNQDLNLWFVLQARSVDDFEKMPSRIQVTLTHKDSEIKRRSEEIMKSRENSIFHICELDDELKKPHVVNFEFYISKKKKVDFSNIPIYYNEFDSPLNDSRKIVPNRVHDIEIPGFNENVVVRVSKFPGTHGYPWHFSSGGAFKNSKPKNF